MALAVGYIYINGCNSQNSVLTRLAEGVDHVVVV
jgi:hypothetical protein